MAARSPPGALGPNWARARMGDGVVDDPTCRYGEIQPRHAEQAQTSRAAIALGLSILRALVRGTRRDARAAECLFGSGRTFQDLTDELGDSDSFGWGQNLPNVPVSVQGVKVVVQREQEGQRLASVFGKRRVVVMRLRYLPAIEQVPGEPPS